MVDRFEGRYHTESESVRKPIRPLGKISDVAAVELPAFLADIRNGTDVNRFSESVDQAVARINLPETIAEISEDQHTLSVATLDAKMLITALYRSDGQPGPHLKRMTGVLSAIKGEVASLLYGNIILDNPTEDLRTFTDIPEEAVFYRTHQRVEDNFQQAIDSTQGIIKGRSPYEYMAAHAVFTHGVPVEDELLYLSLPSESLRENLGIVEQSLDANTREMKTLARMDPRAFQVFRHYLDGIKELNLPGPSGEYTARMRRFEIMLSGLTLSPESYFEIAAKNHLFDPEGREGFSHDLVQAAKERTLRGVIDHYLLVDPVGEDTRGLARAAHAIDEKLGEFRKSHLAAVMNLIIKPMGQYTSGTGGEKDIKGYLEQRTVGNRHFQDYPRPEGV